MQQCRLLTSCQAALGTGSVFDPLQAAVLTLRSPKITAAYCIRHLATM